MRFIRLGVIGITALIATIGGMVGTATTQSVGQPLSGVFSVDIPLLAPMGEGNAWLDPTPTTTTTTAAPPVVQQAAPARTSWPASLEPCGGDLPPCYVKDRESHGDYNARNPSGACGAWQIMPGTWAMFEGYASACDAPPAIQDEKARQLWNGGLGCGHWSAC